MALPVLSRTWQVDPNNATSGATLINCWRSHIWQVKNALINFANAPFTIYKSSDGTTQGAADYWTTTDGTNLTFAAAGTAHAWIVLTSAGPIPFQICFDCDASSAAPWNAEILFSPGGLYTGGTLQNRPTATDEVAIDGGNFGCGGNRVGTWSSKIQVFHSTNGAGTRVHIYTGNIQSAVWLIENAKNPLPEWTNAVVAGIVESASSAPSDISAFTNFSGGTAWLRGRTAGGTNFLCWPSYETYKAQTTPFGNVQTAPCDLNNAYSFGGIGLVSETSGARGRLGEIADLWWGQYALRSHGDTYPAPPNTPLKQFIQMNPFIEPWDQATTLQTT